MEQNRRLNGVKLPPWKIAGRSKSVTRMSLYRPQPTITDTLRNEDRLLSSASKSVRLKSTPKKPVKPEFFEKIQRFQEQKASRMAKLKTQLGEQEMQRCTF